MLEHELQKGDPEEMNQYQKYSIKVDPNQDDKATEIRICNASRPHMRAFHCAWFGYFITFIVWFAIAPLLPEIKKSLNLSNNEIWTSNIVSVASTIVMRILVGPGCDKFGPRILFSIALIYASIPTACVGFVNSANGLIAVRFFIGIVGCTFVMCQFWCTRMFTKDVIGTANAVAGGWGNLGGGVTQLLMGSILFPLFKIAMSAEMAWRTVCIVPAVVSAIYGFTLYFISDDTPKGNYIELKKNGILPDVSASTSFYQGMLNLNTWILFIQYACCFGVELTMNNAAALYFVEVFDQTTESAAAIASIFGWMNLFARGLGGFCSDKLNSKFGMRGRLICQSSLLILEACMIYIFNRTRTLSFSILSMIFFSIFVQACEGSTYGIVPYVNSIATGSISGIVGAGGNTGAVCFSLAFRQLQYTKAFDLIAAIIMCSSLLSPFISIEGENTLFSKGKVSLEKEQSLEETDSDIEKDSSEGG